MKRAGFESYVTGGNYTK